MDGDDRSLASGAGAGAQAMGQRADPGSRWCGGSSQGRKPGPQPLPGGPAPPFCFPGPSLHLQADWLSPVLRALEHQVLPARAPPSLAAKQLGSVPLSITYVQQPLRAWHSARGGGQQWPQQPLPSGADLLVRET